MGAVDEGEGLLPEQRARQRIDEMLIAAGWVVQDYGEPLPGTGCGGAGVDDQCRPGRLRAVREPSEVWAARLEGRITPGDAKQAYLYLYMERLAGLGYKYLLVRPIHTSRNELYAMVFASDSIAGQKLMRWSQQRDRVRPRPGTLFDVPEPRPEYEDLYTGWRGDFPIELPPWVELEN